jgi:hypothetical protein
MLIVYRHFAIIAACCTSEISDYRYGPRNCTNMISQSGDSEKNRAGD